MAITRDCEVSRVTDRIPLLSLRAAAAHVGHRLAALVLVAGMSATLSLLSSAPAAAQMLGMTMTQIAGPFAGRLNPNGGMMAGYGSQAGVFAHLMQGTQAVMPSMQNTLSGLSGMRMASTSQTANPQSNGSMTMSENSGAKPNEPGGKSGEKSGGPDAPDSGDSGGSFWDLMIGACAGGAFIGGFSAATATAPVAVTGVAAPIAATAVASAMGVGCGLGVATAAVSLGAVMGWRSATR